MIRVALAVLTALQLAAGRAPAQKSGEMMFVVKRAELRDGGKVLATIHPGAPVRVRQVRGDWLLVANGKCGWIRREALAPARQAIAAFTARIRQSPKDEAAYVVRGVIRNSIGETDGAIADFSAAIQLDPKDRSAYANRAIAWRKKGEYEIALKDYNHAIWLDPTRALTYHNRAHVWLHLKNYGKAESDLKQAIRLEPTAFDGYNTLAWLQATCPEAKFRDGKRAVKNARTACRLCRNGHWYCLGTLAAAYAEAGDFQKAVRWEQKTIERAPVKERAQLRKLLQAFESGHAFHQSPHSREPLTAGR